MEKGGRGYTPKVRGARPSLMRLWPERGRGVGNSQMGDFVERAKLYFKDGRMDLNTPRVREA